MTAQQKIEAAPAASVYAKIAAVQAELAKHGIAKNRHNNSPGGNYAFRGIDDIYNALAPLLAANGLCVLPRILTREVVERKSAKGNALFYITVEAEFDFVSADDGSLHTVRTFGEAMDSGDKGTNKAMSAAFKYAAFMTFTIPTEGDNDTENVTHEVAAVEEMPDAEWAKLVHLIEVTNSNTTAMLKFYKVPDLRKLTVAQYEHAINSLNDKLAKAAKAETDAKAKETVDA